MPNRSACHRDPSSWVFLFSDLLFELYGQDRGEWPDPAEWPWHLVPATGAP